MDDSDGVFARWMATLDEPTQLQVSAQFLAWRNVQQWSDQWENRFEAFGDIFIVEVACGGKIYKVYACRKTIYEMVFLLVVESRKKRLPPEMQAMLEYRLGELAKNPENCREYKFQ
jgi:hypothetical protein